MSRIIIIQQVVFGLPSEKVLWPAASTWTTSLVGIYSLRRLRLDFFFYSPEFDVSLSRAVQQAALGKVPKNLNGNQTVFNTDFWSAARSQFSFGFLLVDVLKSVCLSGL